MIYLAQLLHIKDEHRTLPMQNKKAKMELKESINSIQQS